MMAKSNNTCREKNRTGWILFELNYINISKYVTTKRESHLLEKNTKRGSPKEGKCKSDLHKQSILWITFIREQKRESHSLDTIVRIHVVDFGQ